MDTSLVGASCEMACVSGREEIEITLPSASDTITLQLDLTGHNRSSRRLYVDVEDGEDWSFLTGVGSDMVEIYSALQSGFMQVRACGWRERSTACCSDGMDNDADGLIDAYDEDCL